MDNLKAEYKKAIESDKMYVLINLNIKNYRYIYYVYGIEYAQHFLLKIENAIKNTLLPDDTVSRMERDDFFILKSYTNIEELEKNYLITLVDAVFEIDDKYMYKNCYASLGLFLMNDKDHFCSFEEAMDKAIFSRISSKTLHSRTFNYEFYKPNLLAEYIESYRMEEITANARSKNLYEVYIQPKVDIRTQQIIGGEALLRLPYEGKQMPASDFMSILNKNGYIRLADLYVCEKVVKYMTERFHEGKRNVCISLNISNSYFYDELLLEDYCSIMNKYSMDTSYLELEFMETIKIDEQRLKQHVSDFHKHGFSCALDDFGNGYSNFNVLRTCNIDTVKIDRCFFIEPLNNETKKILNTMIHLIKYLGMKVIAEGVERKEDVEFLKTTECDAIQGFYFYKPMPMDEFFVLLDQQS